MIGRVYRLVDTKRIEMKQREVFLKAGHVLVKPGYMSICAADQRYYLGKRKKEILKQKLPMALIHEATGKVLYDPCKRFLPGENVVLVPLDADSQGGIKGNYREGSKFASGNTDGFLRDLIVLSQDRLVKIPGEYTVEYVFSELLSVAIGAIKGFMKFRLLEPESFGVWGDGSVGFVMSLALKCFYPKAKLYIFGKNRRKLRKFSFAAGQFYIDQLPLGLTVTHAFECVGGSASEAAISQIVDIISPQGCVNLLGVSEESVSINTRGILEKGLQLIGNSRSDRSDIAEAVTLISENEQCRKYLRMLISEMIEVEKETDISHAFEQDLLNDFKTVMEWKM